MYDAAWTEVPEPKAIGAATILCSIAAVAVVVGLLSIPHNEAYAAVSSRPVSRVAPVSLSFVPTRGVAKLPLDPGLEVRADSGFPALATAAIQKVNIQASPVVAGFVALLAFVAGLLYKQTTSPDSPPLGATTGSIGAKVAHACRRILGRRPECSPMAMMAVTCAEIDANFPPLKNDNALRAIRGHPVDRIPVWVMRQAGRYLPEYVEYTKDKEFFSRCQNPEVACHLTLQPFDRYDLDAGIIFSDILVIPYALGMDVKMVKGQGPTFTNPLRTKEQWYEIERKLLERVGVVGVPPEQQDAQVVAKAAELADALDYVYQAITLTRTKLNGRAPLIGFCGSPWTLFVYACEAKKTKTYTECSKLIYGQPELVHRILKVMAHVCAEYLIRQVKAGAQMLQVFDSHANVLPPKQWREFSLPYLNLIAKLVKEECPDIPMIVLPKDAPFALKMLKDSPYDMVSIDPTLDLGESYRAMAEVGKGIQGNMSPTTMYAPTEKVRELAREYLAEAFGDGSTLPRRYIANLGAGMNPDMDPANLGAFVDTIHSFGSK